MSKCYCINCGKRKGNKEPGNGATWHAGVCDGCGEKGYLTEARDFGISEVEDDEVFNKLSDMFGFNK